MEFNVFQAGQKSRWVSVEYFATLAERKSDLSSLTQRQNILNSVHVINLLWSLLTKVEYLFSQMSLWFPGHYYTQDKTHYNYESLQFQHQTSAFVLWQGWPPKNNNKLFNMFQWPFSSKWQQYGEFVMTTNTMLSLKCTMQTSAQLSKATRCSVHHLSPIVALANPSVPAAPTGNQN